ncbi:hypothetical protein BX600DRAFT_510367 [Xylariales sp. PMI_506]|nr:hypothetical protein BX600DRAFT_510367 [Xylariales sp. PMI_506]
MSWVWKSTWAYSAIEKFPSSPARDSVSTSPSDIGDDEDNKRFIGASREHVPIVIRRPNKTWIVLTIVNVLVLLLSVLSWVFQYQHRYLLNADLRRVSSYSPIHDLLDLELHTATVNGTFFPDRKHPSLARQMPDPSADEIWEEWELTRVFPITREQVVKLGKNPETAAKLENDIWGLGDDAYIGVFDVYHQLHCLNSLRQIAYGSYYNMSTVNPDKKHASIPEFHVNHCVDILMQALQCSGNVNLMTYHWVETQDYPFPDMSVQKKCISFDKLTEFRRANTIDMDKYVEVMHKPDGVKELKMSDQWYEYLGRESPNHPNGADPDNDFNL